jgi:hypothetical protein
MRVKILRAERDHELNYKKQNKTLSTKSMKKDTENKKT